MKRQKLLLPYLLIIFTSHLSGVLPNCEIIDSVFVRDPDICFQSCQNRQGTDLCKLLGLDDGCQEASPPRTICEWKCTPAPKRYVEVRTCCPGYRNSTITGQCEEVNECEGEDGRFYCEGGSCINTPGSYKCLCPDGYHTSRDGSSCEDNDECALDTTLCRHGKCINTNGSYECDCPPGHRLSDDGKFCLDIDECEFTHCHQQCINTVGSFHCTCQSGYQLLKDGKTCQDIDECNTKFPPVCIGTCINTKGSFHCECPQGYRLEPDGSNCTDIDECKEGLGHCHASIGKCVNIPGSFFCSCMPGFTLSGDGFTCLDNNECQDGTANCEQLCENTFGSYICKNCPTGYRFHNKTCIDIDECQDGTAKCQETCINEPGSYSCSCPPGYELATDEATCQDIDECEAVSSFCSHFCENTEGSYMCSCPEYMSLSSADNATCSYIQYGEFFNAGTHRIFASVFICIGAIVVLAIVIRIVYRHYYNSSNKRQIIEAVGNAGEEIRKFNIFKKHERAFGYHLKVPAIDEDIKHNSMAPEIDKLI